MKNFIQIIMLIFLKRTHTFFKNWFGRKFTPYCTELCWHCVTADGDQLTREDVINKMTIFFEAFSQFKNDGYKIDNTSFDLQEKATKGLGFSEGNAKI
jgi:hypothetical protein